MLAAAVTGFSRNEVMPSTVSDRPTPIVYTIYFELGLYLMNYCALASEAGTRIEWLTT